MNGIYRTTVYFPAWSANNGSTLMPAADARDADFGTLMLTEFKQFARITYDNDDNIIPLFINSAIEAIEQALEFCILPRTFDWTVATEYQGWEKFEVPLRNTKTAGAIYDFTPLRAMNIIDKPAAWPVSIVCGFDSPDEIPNDLRLLIFETAASYELNRTASDASTVVMPLALATKYGVMRC